jgi:hypothetical protein
MTICSLLFIDRTGSRPENLRASNADPIDIYVGCASLLSKSAAAAGETFTLISNAESDVREVCRRLNLEPPVIRELDFDLDIPTSTRFYQAHHKIRVLQAFGDGLFDEWNALIDLDAVILRNFSNKLSQHHGLSVYDISSSVPTSYIASLEALLDGHAPPTKGFRWFGGEFLGGSTTLFARLSEVVTGILPTYLRNIHDFPHIGDETVVSAALNVCQQQGIDLNDAGACGLIARWWSSRTLHRQPLFSEVSGCSILHLPADKDFLSSMGHGKFDAASFPTRYIDHVRLSIQTRRLLNPFLKVTGRPGIPARLD